VLLSSAGTQKITDTFLPSVQPDYTLEDPELKELLAQGVGKNKNKAKKKKKKVFFSPLPQCCLVRRRPPFFFFFF